MTGSAGKRSHFAVPSSYSPRFGGPIMRGCPDGFPFQARGAVRHLFQRARGGSCGVVDHPPQCIGKALIPRALSAPGTACSRDEAAAASRRLLQLGYRIGEAPLRRPDLTDESNAIVWSLSVSKRNSASFKARFALRTESRAL
jgi:hypothetical protein